MSDFSLYSNFNARKGFIGVRFGAYVPLLEVELNEFQDILSYKRKLTAKTTLTSGFVNKTIMTYSSGVLTIPADTIVTTEGDIIEFTEDITIECASGDHVYLTTEEVVISYLDTIKTDGNTTSITSQTNDIYDSRVDKETSRRIQVQLTPVLTVDATPDEGVTYLDVASITGASTFTDTRNKVAVIGSGVDALNTHVADTILTSDLTLDIPTDYSTIQAALDSLDNTFIPPDVSVYIVLPDGITSITSEINVNHRQGNRIFIQGQTPVNKTISSVGAVTGSAGNWSVPITVVNLGTDASIGDFVIVNGTTGTGNHQVHRGIWEVVGINTDIVTLKNTCQESTFPTTTLTGGTLSILSSTVTCVGCGFINIDDAHLGGMSNFGIIGDATAGMSGIDVSRGTVQFTDKLGSTGFENGLNVGSGGVAFTSTTAIFAVNNNVYGMKISGKFDGAYTDANGNSHSGFYAYGGTINVADAKLIACGNVNGLNSVSGGLINTTNEVVSENTNNYVYDIYSDIRATGFSTSPKSIVQCTSTTRPTYAYQGQKIYETDTDNELKNIGTYAVPVWFNDYALISSESDYVACGYEPLGGVIRIDDNDPRITYSPGDWQRISSADTIEGNFGYLSRSTNVGAILSFSFIGTGLVAYLTKGAGYGKISVSIDDSPTTYDRYEASSVIGEAVSLASGLSFGKHDVVITVLNKNPLASENYISIYGFDVITTTTSSYKLAMDGERSKSLAITENILQQSLTDISGTIDEITNLIPNASLKRISPAWGKLFQDSFTRTDGAAGNGWATSGTVAISGNKLSISPAGEAFNGSSDWIDRRLRGSFVQDNNTTTIYIKHVDANNYVYATVTTGSSNNIKICKVIGGVYTAITTGSFAASDGSTYYFTLESVGDLYSFSITANSDYVTAVTTIYAYTTELSRGLIGLRADTNNGSPVIFDDIVVTGPIAKGTFPYSGEYNVGACGSYVDNIFKTVNALSCIGGINWGGYPSGVYANEIEIPGTVGTSYTFKLKRKLSAYTSGNGAHIRIAWYQSDKTTLVSANASAYVTAVDTDFVEATVTGTAPANAAYAIIGGILDGIGTCEWKEPWFGLEANNQDDFHEKESRMDLICLKNDGTIVVTKGTGEDEKAYRVEAEDGSISKFYRDKNTIPHWNRVKTWRGGTGWYSYFYPSESAGNMAETITLNDAYYISFVGTGIDMLVLSNNYRGIIGVTIDEGTEFLIDTYSATTIYQNRISLARGLSYGQHQVKIRCTASGSLAPGSFHMSIDAFDIYAPKIPDTPANCQPLGAVLKADPDDGWIRYNNNEGVVYSGTWSTINTVESFNGDRVLSNTLNNYGEFSFIGTGIRYVGTKGPGSGIVEVLIDEGAGYVSKGMIDLYHEAPAYNEYLYGISILSLTLNKIKILCTHTKNASASEYYIGLAAFDVKQPLYVFDLRNKISEGALETIKHEIKDYVGDVTKLNTLRKQDIIDAINSHLSDSLAHNAPKYTTANLTYYVDATNGSDINDGLAAGSGRAFKTIAKAVSMIPMIVNHTVTINVAAGTYNESIYLRGFLGRGSITINGGNSTATAVNYIITGTVSVFYCSCTINVTGFNSTDTTHNNFAGACCVDVNFVYCVSTVAAPSCYGIDFQRCLASVYACQISNHNYAIVTQKCSTVYSDSWTAGSGNGTGLCAATGSTICKNGTQPQGTIAEITNGGGVIR